MHDGSLPDGSAANIQTWSSSQYGFNEQQLLNMQHLMRQFVRLKVTELDEAVSVGGQINKTHNTHSNTIHSLTNTA